MTRTTIDLAEGVADAELVVVCTPVGDIVDHVCQVAEHCPPSAIITDVGSTKANIVRQLADRLAGACVSSAVIRWRAAKRRARSMRARICLRVVSRW